MNDNPNRPVAATNVAPQATRAPANQPDDGIPGEAIAGVLAALGIAAVGYAAMRSRRRRVEAEDDAIVTAPIETVHDQRVANAAPAFGTTQSAPAAAEVRYGFNADHGPAREGELIEREPMTMDRFAPQRTQAFAMPGEAPATSEERSALLDRMVEAEPDDANPFVSRKARRKRARLLLQQNEDQAGSDTAFDWRTYRSAAQPSVPASPELITA